MMVQNLDKETRMKLLQFVRQYGNSLGRFLVLRFWSQHPCAHFTLPCIDVALEGKKLDLQDALGMLVEEGIVQEQISPRGLTLYSLTSDLQKREPVLALAQLDWEQAQKLAFLAAHRWPANHVLAQV